MSILLSICIPTFNRRERLEETLNCLLPQCKGQNVEIIVSDNASNDSTANFCLLLEESNNFFHFFQQAENKGFSSNLVHVLSQAKGKYLWMLGDDEILHPKALHYILDAVVALEPSWLLCNFVKVDDKAGAWSEKGELKLQAKKAYSLDEALNLVGVWASFMSINVIRRDLFDEWFLTSDRMESDYIGFSITLFVGHKGHCFFLPDPVLARLKTPLSEHRFDNASTYLFDFFSPVDEFVHKGKISPCVRIKLSHEMFLSMVVFLLLKGKVRGTRLPSVFKSVRYHYYIPMFWLLVFPMLILPGWAVKLFLSACYLIPKKKGSKLGKLLEALKC